MFYTVSLVNPAPRAQWQATLLDHSWRRVNQEGLLIQLLPASGGVAAGMPPPRHARRLAVGAPPFPPISADHPAAMAAALFEWVCQDRPQGTVLVLPAKCMFRRAVTQHVAPGVISAQPWLHSGLRKPARGYPFGFPPGFSFLSECCLGIDVQPASVTLPLLIHSDDLRKVAPRWLQLCSQIAGSCCDAAGKPIPAASEYALLAALAEFELLADVQTMLTSVSASAGMASDGGLLGYAEPLFSREGKQIFNQETFVPWSYLREDQRPETDAGTDFVTSVNACGDAERSAAGLFTLQQVPRWSPGVMEGRVKDDIFLEMPQRQRSLWLNSGGKDVWELCDGSRNVDDIRSELVRRYPGAEAAVPNDVLAVIDMLGGLEFLQRR